ncbi:MAG: NTP transferase domain-containing protein [Candidatus Diapherotrites archaeon]|uniref:glucose-1-phosphate thymidylyltransferase n=1 Tax=Candidatus Iainarchaeum sp. TaxID=3101447 RepID=A0A8T4L790_9ARCH|nr:NTP transferase domain-containing protein [Candidatus Diapherotrites archaeon]
MKGVILAGGMGSRLKPLTSVTNKHLLPIYDKPMIFYPIQILKDAGITEIMVVTGTHHAGAIFQLLGSGHEYGVKFTYRVQDQAGGIPQAIGLAEGFVGDDKFVSVNGDNILFENIKPFVDEFEKGKEEARILLYNGSREDAQKSGVAVLEGDKVLKIVEKPKDPPSNWISIGVLMFTPGVFDIIKTLKPSARGELEISDVQNEYIRRGTLKASKLRDEWLDAGTIDELVRVNQIIAEHEQKKKRDSYT